MAKIIGGIGTSHVPSVGVVYDQGRTEEPAWKPLFDGYKPVQKWIKENEVDVAVVVYNDHGGDFFFDKYPTFAVGAAAEYPLADEGFGIRPLPVIRGHSEFSWHLCEHLVYNEFDITVCQELKVEHGFLVPMHLCFDSVPDWSVKAVPIQVNVIQHPLPTALRCYKFGQPLRNAISSWPEDLNVVILGTGGMSHQLSGERFGYINSDFDSWWLDTIENEPETLVTLTHQEIMEKAGVEAVELIMWLVMRGALSDRVERIHRNYYAPMTTGRGLLALANLT